MMDKRSNVVSFLTKSQRLAVDLMKTFGMKESIIESFKEGKVLRTHYIHYNKIFQSDVTERDIQVMKDLMESGHMVYHILLSLDMNNKEPVIMGENPVIEFDELVTRKCFLSVPINIYDEATRDDGHEVGSRQETLQNYIEHILAEAQWGFLSGYVSSGVEDKLVYSNIEVTVVRGNLVQII